LLVFNEEFLVSASHQLTLTMSMPFVHIACRSYRLNGPMKCSDCGDMGGSLPTMLWEVRWTLLFRGRGSRNKVSVGEHEEGSLLMPYMQSNTWISLNTYGLALSVPHLDLPLVQRKTTKCVLLCAKTQTPTLNASRNLNFALSTPTWHQRQFSCGLCSDTSYRMTRVPSHLNKYVVGKCKHILVFEKIKLGWLHSINKCRY